MPAGAENPTAAPPAPIAPRMGRPPKYKPDYHPQTASKLIDAGLTDHQLAEFFEVAPRTICVWKLDHPEFAKAVELPLERRLRIVENSLYLRATGYSHPAVRIFAPSGDSQEPVIVPYTEYHPPDVGAINLFLSNRDPKRWKKRLAPAEDAPAPGAAAEAEQKRRVAFATMMAIIEERARKGEPPIFAQLPQARPAMITGPLRQPEAILSEPAKNGAGGNGHGPNGKRNG